jgi:hypothetical protein
MARRRVKGHGGRGREVLRLKAAILELVGECAGYVILAVTWMRE